MLYWIMNKDRPLVSMRLNNDLVYRFTILKVSNHYPFSKDSDSINAWILKRRLPTGRENFNMLLELCDVKDIIEYINVTKCVSLNDTLWIKKQDDGLSWSDVSPYSNPLNRAMSDLCLTYNLPSTKLVSSFSPELSTLGSFPKCWKRINGNIFQIKGVRSKDSTTFGLEPYSEYFAYQLALKLNFKRVARYKLGKYRGMLVTYCRLFTSEKYGYIPMSVLFPYSNYEDDFKFFTRLGCEDQFRRLMIFDSIIYNKDRHRGNYGVIVRNSDFRPLTISPVFDNNLALLPFLDLTKSDEDIKNLLNYHNKAHETGVSFIEQAKMFITPSIYQDVLKLRGFKFTQDKLFPVDNNRLNFINSLVQDQVQEILNACK